MPANQKLYPEFASWNEFSKLFEQYGKNPLDLKSLMETNRKNILALSEIGQTAVENIQDIVSRQNEIMSQMMEDNTRIAREIMSEGTPEEKMAKNADIFKKIYERSYKNMKELAQLVNEANDKTTGIINKRVSASMNEIKSSLEKAPKKAA